MKPTRTSISGLFIILLKYVPICLKLRKLPSECCPVGVSISLLNFTVWHYLSLLPFYYYITFLLLHYHRSCLSLFSNIDQSACSNPY